MTHLVLLHGWGATGAVWRRQVEAFEVRCTVYAPTLPRWEFAWVADFLEKIPLAHAVVVGWSLGGMLLLETLVEHQAKPAGLILVGVPAAFCQRQDHYWGQPPAVVRAMRRALKHVARQVLEDFAARCLAPEETVFKDEVTTLFQSDMAEDHLAAGLDYLLTADLRSRLPQLAAKPVIVQGEADNIVPPEQARYLNEHLPGSRLISLPGAGHLPFITQAARFNEIVMEVMGEGRGNAVPPPSPTPPPNPL
jgi:pimeloyl-[acyl-carrier protein] methyl ester esterase